MSEPLKNYEQAAEWLGVPQRWLEDQVQAGKAPHARLGKHVRFTQEHLDFIVRSHEPMRTAPAAPEPAAAGPRPSGRRRRKS